MPITQQTLEYVLRVVALIGLAYLSLRFDSQICAVGASIIFLTLL